MQSNCLIVIPARYASERFPGKVLHKLNGKPVLQWCYESALRAGLGRVIIATEHEKVLHFAKTIGAETCLTSPKCKSGTDRVFETALRNKREFIINYQADEPFMEPGTLIKAFELLKKNPQFHITTACSPIYDKKDLINPNTVKVALGKNSRAVYFSRIPIPFHHPLSAVSMKIPWYKHCGFYVYRYDALKKFVSLPESVLESLERLEQLRALEAGLCIGAVKVPRLGPAIDVRQDIKKAEQYLIKYIQQ
ncbi:MAG: 3-deoxy-manno-octulosonate cytidylyltransferase [Elusimicrobia bacterium]|nr:3-deoxy-manno-octulosonate cytidylyltransferase [Elusimicrobiota bacterium]